MEILVCSKIIIISFGSGVPRPWFIHFGPPTCICVYLYHLTNYRIQISCFVEFRDGTVQMSGQHIGGWLLFLVVALAHSNLLFIFIQLRTHSRQQHYHRAHRPITLYLFHGAIKLGAGFLPQRFQQKLKFMDFIDCRWCTAYDSGPVRTKFCGLINWTYP